MTLLSTHSKQERRRTPRYRCHGPIDFRIQGWYLQKGRILNLCLNGCLIEPQTGSGYEVGDELETRFEVNRLTFRAQCIVRRVHPSGDLALEILRLSSRSSRQLRELVEELEAMGPPAIEL